MTKEEREKEIKRVMELLPQQPDDPKAVVRLMQERGLLKGDVIVYKCDMYYDPLQDRRRQGVICHCSACGDSWWTEKIAAGPTTGCSRSLHSVGFENFDGAVWHGNDTMCPQCGAEVKARHVSAFGAAAETYIDGDHCLTVNEAGGHLAVLDWYVEKKVDKTGGIHHHIHGYEGAVIIDRTFYRVSGHSRAMGGGECWFVWTRRKGRVCDLTAVCKICQLIPFADELVARTDADKSGFEDYCRSVNDSDGFLPCSYLQLWCRFPQAENLVRTGNARFVTGLIVASQVRDGSYWTSYEYFSPNNTRTYADWKKTKPNEILHLEKDEYRLLTGRAFETINYYLSIKDDYGVRLTPELLEKAERIGVMKCREITKDKKHYGRKVSPVRVINYVYRQKMAVAGTTRTFYPSDLLDHWRMLKDYYGEVPVSMMFPADFFRHHQRISQLIADKGNKELNEKITRATEQARRYAWEDAETGLLITPARCAEDLKAEGAALDHCVATYAERVALGETMIFFIRRIDAPDVPFFTLEYKNDKVIQNRGYKNSGSTEQVQTFETRWLAHIEQLKKEEKERGQSDADGKRGDAAA